MLLDEFFPGEDLTTSREPFALWRRSCTYHRRAPMLLLHGRLDLCVPESQAQEMYQALVDAGCESGSSSTRRAATAGRNATTCLTVGADEDWSVAIWGA